MSYTKSGHSRGFNYPNDLKRLTELLTFALYSAIVKYSDPWTFSTLYGTALF